MNKFCNCAHGAAQVIVNPQVRLALELPLEGTEDLPLFQQLILLRNSLNKDNWIKGRYFNSIRAMCQLGAGAGDSRALVGVVASVAAAAAAAAGATNNLKEIWKNRPNNYRENTKYGNKNIHYLMGMFGLTASFNDAKETTLEMIHAKLDEMIAWVNENQEFVDNN